MGEFQIGRKMLGADGSRPGQRPGGSRPSGASGSSSGVDPYGSSDERGGTGRSQGGDGADQAGPSGLGLIGRLAISADAAAEVPDTLDKAVEAIELKLYELLDEADPAPNPDMERMVAGGFEQYHTSQLNNLDHMPDPTSLEHVEEAMAGNRAYIPMPLSEDRMNGWWNGWTKGARTAVNLMVRDLTKLNHKIDLLVKENDLSPTEVQDMIRSVVSPKSTEIFKDGDDFEEDIIKKKPGKETFGAWYTALSMVNHYKDALDYDGQRKEIIASMRSLFQHDMSGNIAIGLGAGAHDLLNEKIKEEDWVTSRDPQERNNEVALGLLDLLSDIGENKRHWTFAERKQFQKFMAEVRNAAFNHPELTRDALRQKYFEEGEMTA